MEFSSKLDLPILKEEIRYTHLNNSNYLDILKFISNNDDNGLLNYFNYILTSNICDKSLIYRLSNIEKFIILLDLRSKLLGDKLQGILKDEESIIITSIPALTHASNASMYRSGENGADRLSVLNSPR